MRREVRRVLVGLGVCALSPLAVLAGAALQGAAPEAAWVVAPAVVAQAFAHGGGGVLAWLASGVVLAGALVAARRRTGAPPEA